MKNPQPFGRLLASLVAMVAVLVGTTLASVSNAAPKTYPVKRLNDITFAEPDGVELKLDLYLPEGLGKKPPLIMFIHGGGWTNGDRKNCKLSWAAEYGYAIASVEYRLSHEGLFPAQIRDCKGALRWLRAHADEYGYDANSVVVAGTSAGGHLAAMMGTSGGVEELEGDTAGNLDQSSRVQAVINYYGPADFVARSEDQPHKTDEPNGSVYKLIGGPVKENLEAARAASPATYVSDDDPPMLILHGAKDKTVLLNQAELLKALYEETGLDVALLVEAEAGHGWKKPFPDEQKTVLQFLEKHLSGKSESE